MSGASRLLPALALAAWLLLPASSEAEGQAGAAPAFETPSVIDASLLVGVLTPLGDLTVDPRSFGTAVTTSAAVSGALAWWPARRWGLEAEATYAPADLRIKPTEFPGVVPDALGEARWWAGTVNLVHRMPLRGAAAVAEPYVAVGAGLRHLSVDEIASPEVEDATDPMAAVGAGLAVRMTPVIALRVELRNRISSYESPATGDARLQNDLLVAVGLRARLR